MPEQIYMVHTGAKCMGELHTVNGSFLLGFVLTMRNASMQVLYLLVCVCHSA